MNDKRWWLAILNGAFGGSIMVSIVSDMLANNGNIVLKARPVAENYSAADTLLIFALAGLFIANAIAWCMEEH